MKKRTKTKSKSNLYLVIISIIVMLLLVYNQNNRNTNFDSTGIYIAGTQNNKITPSKEKDNPPLPGVLRWINPFD